MVGHEYTQLHTVTSSPTLVLQDFAKTHAATLRRFRLTGTASTMTMLRSIMGEDQEYGPTCASGPLGGDAQV